MSKLLSELLVMISFIPVICSGKELCVSTAIIRRCKKTHTSIYPNNISDISVIRELPELSYLELYGNPISDYSPVYSLSDDCEVYY